MYASPQTPNTLTHVNKQARIDIIIVFISHIPISSDFCVENARIL